MNGSHPTPVEQHLGDRLAALVDGELNHDARDRVLAHLATCPRCKAEADAQRRLKSFFAEAAPPPPSASFLARLQGLPGGDSGDDSDDSDGTGPGISDRRRAEYEEPSGPFGGFGGFGGLLGGLGRGAAESALDTAGRPRDAGSLFRYAPSGAHSPVLPGSDGFRVHAVGRARGDAAERSRSRRFAFAAAGAVSLAAIALGGVTTGTPAAPGAPGGGTPSNATPLRAPGPATVADAVRRRSAAAAATTRSERSGPSGDRVALAGAVTAPLLPGVPAPHPPAATGGFPLTAGDTAPPAPLIRISPAPSDPAVAAATPPRLPRTDHGVVAAPGGPGTH